MVEEINSLRKQNGVPALKLDEELQEYATQLAAEMSFYPDMMNSYTRPDGSDMYTLATKSIYEIFPVGAKVVAFATDEQCKSKMSRVYTSNPLVTGDDSCTSIGIGIYQAQGEAMEMTYAVLILGMDNVSQGNFKTTAKTEIRTIKTNPSNFRLCNAGDMPLLVGDTLDDILLIVNETTNRSICQHASDNRHPNLDNTQATFKVQDQSIASITVTPEGFSITGLKDGHTTIEATLYGQTITYDVDVKDFKLCNGTDKNSEGDGNKITIKGNETVTAELFLHWTDNSHQRLGGTNATWEIEDPAIVSVTPNAQGAEVKGIKAGTTTITAHYYGKSLTYIVTVKDADGEKNTDGKKPVVDRLKDLPKNYQGPAVVGGEELYVKNRKKATGDVTSGRKGRRTEICRPFSDRTVKYLESIFI